MSTKQSADQEQPEDGKHHHPDRSVQISHLVDALARAVTRDMESFEPAITLAAQSPVIDLIGKSLASAAIQQTIAAAAHLTEQVRQPMLQLNKLTEPLQAMMQPWVTAHQKMMEPIVRWMEEDERYAEAIGPYFEEAGLWFSYGMPLSLWGEVRRLYDEGDLSASNLKAAVLDTYQRDDFRFLRLTIDDWWERPEFVRWKRHIGDAFDAHREGKFTLSVPVLIPVCEDIMREVCGDSVAYMPKLAKQIQRMSSEWSLSAVSDQPLASALERLTKSEGSKAVLPKLEARRWHRHRIVHGRDPDYDTAMNSLRFFILLDELHRLTVERHSADEAKGFAF